MLPQPQPRIPQEIVVAMLRSCAPVYQTRLRSLSLSVAAAYGQLRFPSSRRFTQPGLVEKLVAFAGFIPYDVGGFFPSHLSFS